MVAIKEIDNSAKSLVGEKIELGEAVVSDERISYTFLIWLSGKVSDKLESSTISFDISFEEVV